MKILNYFKNTTSFGEYFLDTGYKTSFVRNILISLNKNNVPTSTEIEELLIKEGVPKLIPYVSFDNNHRICIFIENKKYTQWEIIEK